MLDAGDAHHALDQEAADALAVAIEEESHEDGDQDLHQALPDGAPEAHEERLGGAR